MATLTTSYQLLGQTYIGKSGGSLYVRIYAKYSEQDIANNRTKVQYQARSYYENGTYILDQQGRIGVSGTSANYVGDDCTRPTTGETYSVTTEAWVYHNDDGSKSISASGSITFPNWGWNGTASGTADLPNIPRKAEITSAPNFNDEANPTISYSNKAGNSVTTLQACISFTGSNDDIEYRNISKTGSSYTFELTENERNVLRNACTNSNSRDVIFFVKTVLSGNTYYSTLTKTLSIVNGNPTFSNSQLSYLDSNSSIVAITENNQHIVRNQSNLKVTYTGATAKKGASISKYEITFNGGTQTKTAATTIDYGKVNLSSNATVSVKAIDSRGNSTTISKTIQIKDWVLPSATITAGRVNNYEDETRLKANVTISSVNGKNAIQSIQYRYKKSSESSYSSYVSMSNNVQSTLSIDKLYAWKFQIVVTDKFGSTTYNFTIPKGMPIMFVDTKKLTVGINTFPRSNRTLDVDGDFFAPKISSNFITGYSITANGSLHSKKSVIIEDSNGNEKAKLNKNGLYFDEQNILDGFKYSTSEVKTNKVWINNKPIYRKVITTTNTVTNDSTISHNISNADLIYIEKAFIYGSTGLCWDIPIDLYGTGGTSTTDRLNLYVDRSVIGFKCDTSWGTSWTKVIVLEYTKTTD